MNKRLGDEPTTKAISRFRLIACGALARKLLAIMNQLPPGVAELTCLSVAWLNHFEKFFPVIKAKIKAAQKASFTRVVIYGDRDTGGQLDVFFDEENVLRIPGPHCYQSCMGEADFDAATDQELGAFFLTDYMARHFEWIVMKGMGLRDHPHLQDIYFAHCKRVLYVTHIDDAALVEKALRAVATLRLDFDYHHTEYGDYTAFLYNLCRRRQPSVAVS